MFPMLSFLNLRHRYISYIMVGSSSYDQIPYSNMDGGQQICNVPVDEWSSVSDGACTSFVSPAGQHDALCGRKVQGSSSRCRSRTPVQRRFEASPSMLSVGVPRSAPLSWFWQQDLSEKTSKRQVNVDDLITPCLSEAIRIASGVPYRDSFFSPLCPFFGGRGSISPGLPVLNSHYTAPGLSCSLSQSKRRRCRRQRLHVIRARLEEWGKLEVKTDTKGSSDRVEKVCVSSPLPTEADSIVLKECELAVSSTKEPLLTSRMEEVDFDE